MGEAPLNRDEQIDFMENARARRAAALERWENSEMHHAALLEPAQTEAHASQYSREDVVARRCA